jgi:hypothetical protein
MAFDVLQRWHENQHVNTAGYNIHPAQITPVPRTGAFTYINEALSRILPQLDPIEIARRRMALEQMKNYEAERPLRQAQIDLLPQQIELQKQSMSVQSQRNKMLMEAYKKGGINPVTGKPWTESEQNRLRADHAYDIYNHIASQAPSDDTPELLTRPPEVPAVTQ